MSEKDRHVVALVERWQDEASRFVLAHAAHVAVTINQVEASPELSADGLVAEFRAAAERHSEAIGIAQRYYLAAMDEDFHVLAQESIMVAPLIHGGVAIGMTEDPSDKGISKAGLRHLEAATRMAFAENARASKANATLLASVMRDNLDLKQAAGDSLRMQMEMHGAWQKLQDRAAKRERKQLEAVNKEARLERVFSAVEQLVPVAIGGMTGASFVMEKFMALPEVVRDAAIADMTEDEREEFRDMMVKAAKAKGGERKFRALMETGEASEEADTSDHDQGDEEIKH